MSANKLSIVQQQLYPSFENKFVSKVVPFGRSKLLAVGGGKGGIGKSLISANLGLMLAADNKKIIMLDADLGGANLHTCLGLNCPSKGLSDFLANKQTLAEVKCKTIYRHLSLINGAKDALGIANLKYSQKKKIIEHLRKLPADAVVIDLGAGTAFNMIDFFLIADFGLVVSTAEPVSIENAYRFIRAVVLRKMKQVVNHPDVNALIDGQLNAANRQQILTPLQLKEQIKAIDRQSYETIEMSLKALKLSIIFNMIRSGEDYRIGEAMQQACQQYFNINIPFIGGIRFDDAVWRCVRQRKPFVVAKPEAKASIDLRQIAKTISGELFLHK